MQYCTPLCVSTTPFTVCCHVKHDDKEIVFNYMKVTVYPHNHIQKGSYKILSAIYGNKKLFNTKIEVVCATPFKEDGEIRL